MEQRQLRLGDVVDDYCPRERRVTNHAVVALVAEEIKLTRCTTCDTEHPYKAARVPPRRQTKMVAALSNTSATGVGPALQGPVNAEPSTSEVTTPPDPPIPPAVESVPSLLVDSVRRPLIRATLERPEGTPPPTRQAPVFTIRETQGRDGGAEHGGRQRRKRRIAGGSQGQPNGNRVDGHDGQFVWSGQRKNGSRAPRQRSDNRAPNPDRSDRSGKGQSRNRGKGRSR